MSIGSWQILCLWLRCRTVAVEVPYGRPGGPVRQLQKDRLPCLLPIGQDPVSQWPSVCPPEGAGSCQLGNKQGQWSVCSYRMGHPRLHLHGYLYGTFTATEVKYFLIRKLKKKVKGQQMYKKDIMFFLINNLQNKTKKNLQNESSNV